jgi:hypothetical protein
MAIIRSRPRTAGALFVLGMIVAWTAYSLGRFAPGTAPHPLPRLIQPARDTAAPSVAEPAPENGGDIVLIPYRVTHPQPVSRPL